MENAAFTIDGVEVLCWRSRRRSRSISIAVSPAGSVEVCAPLRISLERLQEIIASKMSWIRKRLVRIRDARLEQQSKLIDAGAMTAAERKTLLISRTAFLAGKHGFAYTKLTIRNQRSRWGSCSARNAISLNIKLAQLPGYLVDYVILHELLHTRIKNHRSDYWRTLDGLVGDARSLSKEVRSYRLDLMQ